MIKFLKTLLFIAALLIVGFIIFQMVMVISPASDIFVATQ